MARKGKTGVLKRLREVKKAEKAALKRDQRDQRRQETGETTRVATKDDLAGYGFPAEAGEEEESADLPAPGLRFACVSKRGARGRWISPVLLRPLPFETSASGG